ncbi:hypothetical protein HYW19_00540 [Candidatus Woesearchaeota archaeon]|nr:hypothetical protein [Candidatus Woesearchaeota archaeon]
MANAFSRSWEITKLSFNVMKQDKELLAFPILATTFSLIFIAAMVFPSVFLGLVTMNAEYAGAAEYIILFLIYFGLAFIATFFNVCVVYTTKKRFEGGNATFGESINFAVSKINLIFLWSAVSATVGIILRIIDEMAERAGRSGQILLYVTRSILGVVWSIVTIFVIPGMVYYNLSPFDAIKKSVAVLKKTWGESLVRYYGLGLVQLIVILIGAVLIVPLFMLLFPLGLFWTLGIILLGILYLVVVMLVFGIANQIFNTALFVYADSGKIPSGYNKEIMENAFHKKAQSFGQSGTI